MNYEKKYKAAINWIASLYPEEQKAKSLLNMVLSMPDKKWCEYCISKEEAIEWLKKNYLRTTFKSTTVSTSDITTVTTKLMNYKDARRVENQLRVLRELLPQYSHRTLDNIVQGLEARVREAEKEAEQVGFPVDDYDPLDVEWVNGE